MAREHPTPQPANRSRGDTIVEVIIAIAVVSLVLVGGFTTVNRSSTAVRDSEEHAEALTLLEGQVEAVRALGTDATSAVYTTPIFCVNTTSGAVQAFTIATIPPLSSDISNNFSRYPPDCNGTNNPNLSDLYNIMAHYDQSSNTFEFLTRWDRLGGGGDEVSIFYKPHSSTVVNPPVPPTNPPPTYTSCSDAGIAGETYFYDFRGLGRPWHVWYYDVGGQPQHPLATGVFRSGIAPGHYFYWAIAKDSSYNGWAVNQSLHYNIYRNPSGNANEIIAKTSNTPPINSGTLSGVATGTLDIPAGETGLGILAEHAPKKIPGWPRDDSVDGGCLALRKIT